MTDTGIRYPNLREAEVHVTNPSEPVENPSPSTRGYGWRCEACHESSPSYLNLTIVEARSHAEQHADSCKALPPAPTSTGSPHLLAANIGGVEVLIETDPE